MADNADGIITVKVAGKLTQPEMARAQREAIGIIKRQGKIRVLVVTENFQGWDGSGNWEDVSFQMEHDSQIERMAIVGEKRWENLALMFAGKGFREFPVEYFQPDSLALARAWLAGKT